MSKVLKKISRAQNIIIRIASIVLVVTSILRTLGVVLNLIYYSEYIFAGEILSKVSDAMWYASAPIYLLFSLGILILSIVKKENHLVRATVAYLAMHILFTVLNFVLSLFIHRTDFSWIPSYVGNVLFGTGVLGTRIFVIFENLAIIGLAIALLIGLLGKQEAPRKVSVQAPFEVPSSHHLVPTGGANPTGDLAELVKMFEAGHLTQAEFRAAKKKILE